MNLYTPPDLLEANDAWGANCGPGALAALLRVQVSATRRLFPAFRGHVNPTTMKAALLRSNRRFVPFKIAKGAYASVGGPIHGLLFIQIDGPWCADGVDPRAAYGHTHWIVQIEDEGRRFVYDVNVGESGGWVTKQEWETTVITRLVTEHKRATGWFARLGIAVSRG